MGLGKSLPHCGTAKRVIKVGRRYSEGGYIFLPEIVSILLITTAAKAILTPVTTTKLVHTWSIWALDLNVFGARVEKVADLDCLEGPDFQVVQTIVCVLQLQLCNNSKPDSPPGLQTGASVDCFGVFQDIRKVMQKTNPFYFCIFQELGMIYLRTNFTLVLCHLKMPSSRVPVTYTQTCRCTLACTWGVMLILTCG